MGLRFGLSLFGVVGFPSTSLGYSLNSLYCSKKSVKVSNVRVSCRSLLKTVSVGIRVCDVCGFLVVVELIPGKDWVVVCNWWKWLDG